MAESKDVAERKQAGAVALTFLKAEDNAVGFEDLNISTMAIPFIKVLNAQSPELNKRNVEYIEGATVGNVVNSVTKKNYGSHFDFTVIKFEHIYVEWRQNRGGFVGYHSPEDAERLAVDKTFGNWTTEAGNLLTETYMYYIVIKGHESDGVCVYSADSADIKNAKKLNTMLMSRRLPDGRRALAFHQVYRAETVDMSNDKGAWKALAFSFVDFIDEAFYNVASSERQLITAGEKHVDYSQMNTTASKEEFASAPY